MIAHLEESRESVNNVYKEQCEAVESVWQASKAALVPGDNLIDMVCQSFDVRFKKERGDGERLASLLREDEIDDEIATIIRQIGS